MNKSITSIICDLLVTLSLTAGIVLCSYVNYKQSEKILELQKEIWDTQDQLIEYVEGNSAPGVVKL